MFKITLLTILSTLFNSQAAEIPELPLLTWHEADIFRVQIQSDPAVEKIVDNYIQDLNSNGYLTNRQGVWLQSDWLVLGQNQGKIPASAASLTKIATTLASVETWDLNHQFPTNIYAEGEISEGILDGNLIIEANGDPLLVWEEVIAIGNSLNELGIKQVKGNLVIVGDLMMNYENDALKAGKLVQEALNSNKWKPIIEKQYQTIYPLPPRPQVEIMGNIVVKKELPKNKQLLLTHKSLNLVEILKLMNTYSNNKIADKLTQKIGGGKKIAEIAVSLTGVPSSEIQLINGSGLGYENRISPHAVSKILMALDKKLEGTNIAIADLFPISDIGVQGTIEERLIPSGLPVKTGSLAVASGLAGVISTEERGDIYFALINYGNDLDKMRDKQDVLLQNLEKHWQFNWLKPSSESSSFFGDSKRNILANNQ